jgi:hypothetical protein
VLKRRQDESDQASRKRSGQSGVDCGYQVVVPFGFASHADRLWADGQAAAVHPPWDAIRHGTQGGGFAPSAEQRAEQMKARARAIDDLLSRDDREM